MNLLAFGAETLIPCSLPCRSLRAALALAMAFAISYVGTGCQSRNQQTDGGEQLVVDHARAPNFSQDVAPIFYEHCARCHRPQGSGPFPLLDYRDIAKRTDQIVSVIESGFMPPWLPEDGSFELKGAPTLSSKDVEVLKEWISQGKPRGDMRHGMCQRV